MITASETTPYVPASPELRPILIIDDEASIRRSLEGALNDEGFITLSAADGAKGLELIATANPALVLLDIWMPGIDGIETLRQIKERFPQLAVIMISGHAAISTAMSAIKIGASDFIEKPLDLALTLSAIRRVLDTSESGAADSASEKNASSQFELGKSDRAYELRRVVFEKPFAPGKKVVQRTIARSAIMYGQGLHSGKKSGIIFEPLPPNSGIHMVAVSETDAVPAHLEFVTSTGFATTIRSGRTQVGTIEHLMSALHAYGISNLMIKCNGEVPVFDGSSLEFCKLFDEIELEEQDGDLYAVKVPRLVRVEGKDGEFIQIEPADEFTIDYTLNYPEPLGSLRMEFTLSDVESYRRAIAPSRTFGFVQDIGYLQKQGYALGGRFDNFVLFGPQGAINDSLRFPDEPVRHKILDAIGDLYLLGRPLQGRVTASMTGHSDNVQLLKALREACLKQN